MEEAEQAARLAILKAIPDWIQMARAANWVMTTGSIKDLAEAYAVVTGNRVPSTD